MLQAEKALLVLVDIQGKLAELMCEKDLLYQNLRRLVMGARVLSIPIIWMEQIPEKMGPTIPELRELLTSEEPIAKKCFSCCGEPAFMHKLQATGRVEVILAGIESHVCIYQTAADLITMGYEAHVAADAVSSRTQANRQIGFDRTKAIGGKITSVESILFDIMKTADHPAFREILKIVR